MSAGEKEAISYVFNKAGVGLMKMKCFEQDSNTWPPTLLTIVGTDTHGQLGYFVLLLWNIGV